METVTNEELPHHTPTSCMYILGDLYTHFIQQSVATGRMLRPRNYDKAPYLSDFVFRRVRATCLR